MAVKNSLMRNDTIFIYAALEHRSVNEWKSKQDEKLQSLLRTRAKNKRGTGTRYLKIIPPCAKTLSTTLLVYKNWFCFSENLDKTDNSQYFVKFLSHKDKNPSIFSHDPNENIETTLGQCLVLAGLTTYDTACCVPVCSMCLPGRVTMLFDILCARVWHMSPRIC